MGAEQAVGPQQQHQHQQREGGQHLVLAAESRDVVDRRVLMAPPKALKLRAVARIKPGAEEVAANPRARSAVLRVAERTAVAA